ncbi:BspA family leucine-rich repeat surface protein [Lactobacillus panisapium]|uniref:BspA family leucine-rich repeat surface protein n=1 Tax=Lactobacillus panisapium TaxID=2012495 RepID=UPI001C69D775|nr:BspA family leucine-rich repeat surface protein [Lactobacillus panisapium]QYN59037.1 BspA family leucine-rich repeat surface protein [Lactobacillus panisapium]
MKNNKKKGLIVSSTVVGLVCGLALTQQQAKAATVDSANEQSSAIVQAPKADKETRVSTFSANVNSNDKTNADDSSTADTIENQPTATNGKDTDSNVSASNEEANKQTPTTKAATTPELIDQGIEGTSKWEFKKESNDYVLYVHEGTIDHLPLSGNKTITKIVIDPGVKCKYSLYFSSLENLTTIEGLSNIDTSKWTSMAGMFEGCKSLTSIDLSHFDTSNVGTMVHMFYDCSSLKNLDLSNFDTSKVWNVMGMFQNCSSLESLNINGWVLPNAGDMQYMFSGCSSLKTLDLSSLKAPIAFYLSNLFAGCTSLTSLDLRNLELRETFVPTNNMFLDCKNLNHLVLGTKVLFPQQLEMRLPDVPAVGTLVPGTNKKVTAPYWVATSGYEQGKQYTSDELMKMESRDAITTYDWVAAAPVAETSTESRAVSRLINIHQPDDTTKTITQTAMIKRQVNTNEDGSIDYGAWSTATWDAYDVPVFAGYSASSKQIPAAIVDGQTQDQVVDIFYEPVEQTITVQYLDNGKVVGTQQLTGYVGETITPNYHVPAGYELAASPQPTIKVDATGKQVIKVNVNHKLVQSTEIKTFTRTINVHQPDGTIKTINQVAVVRRTVTIDQATGKRTTGSWHTDIWEKYRLPQITGYTPTKSVIPTKVINANSQNERVDVYYKANK